MDVDADAEMVVDAAELDGDNSTINPAVFTLDQQMLKKDPHPSGDRPAQILKSPLSLLHGKSLDASILEAAGNMIAEEYDSSSDSEIFDGAQQVPQQRVQVVIQPSRFPALPYSSAQTGLVYDWRMREHAEPLLQEEDEIHPEDPRRISEIYQELCDAGLVDDPVVPPVNRDNPEMLLWRLPFDAAAVPDIRLVHSKPHIKWVKSLSRKSDDELMELAASFDSVYLHRSTWMCARLAAGGAIEACRAVVGGQVRNSVAVIRPPGHHAEHDRPGGFCFFDNVAVAAKVCQQEFPEVCRKVLILDWDVHHGNGVQQAFYSDPNVLYISIHVYDNGNFYPQGTYGNHVHCGDGPGLGRNVNVPWPKTGMRDGDYLYAFQKVVMPIATEFDPDLVIVSAGFDAAEGDLLGGCHVTPACYAHMTHMLMSLAKGKITVCLEGGYNLRSIARSTLAVTKTLMGEPPDRLTDENCPSLAGLYTMDMVTRQQGKFWKCMFPKEMPAKPKFGSERMHDVVRSWQSKALFEEHQMTPLFILRNKISKSFENQVLATQNFHESCPLLLIFHDPPALHGIPDPRTNKLELHNTILTDVTKKYVDWAVRNDFSVIDVNIPKHITDPEDSIGYVPADDNETRATLTKSLANYLWENYMEVNDATHIFLMGVGEAYTGLLDLLSNSENCSNRTTHVISFVAENSLQAVKRHTDDSFGTWYYQHSTVFISTTHDAMDPERTRRPRRKYGRLVPSPHSDLVSMMVAHRKEVTDKLLELTVDWREEQQLLEQEQREQREMEDERHRRASLNTSSAPLSHRSSGLSPTSSAFGPPLRGIDDTETAGPAASSSPRRSPGVKGPPVGVFTVGRPVISPQQNLHRRGSRSPVKR